MDSSKSPSMASKLRAALAGGEPIIAPGVYDMLSLLVANRHGFTAHYASGYWVTASMLGLPDVGIAGYSDFITQFTRLAKASAAPLIADADTGFGSLVNLDHAVRGYQQAGIAAMQIEDQTFPKTCGHRGGAVAGSVEDMVHRITIATEARGGGEMLIIARTDARRTEGYDAAIGRLHAYADAGADVLFLEAAQDADEIARAARELPGPLMINAAHGGHTPILDPSSYAKLGAKVVIYPGGAPLAAAQAAESFYLGLTNDDANSSGSNLFNFAEISQMLGLDDAVALEKRFTKS